MLMLIAEEASVVALEELVTNEPSGTNVKLIDPVILQALRNRWQEMK